MTFFKYFLFGVLLTLSDGLVCKCSRIRIFNFVFHGFFSVAQRLITTIQPMSFINQSTGAKIIRSNWSDWIRMSFCCVHLKSNNQHRYQPRNSQTVAGHAIVPICGVAAVAAWISDHWISNEFVSVSCASEMQWNRLPMTDNSFQFAPISPTIQASSQWKWIWWWTTTISSTKIHFRVKIHRQHAHRFHIRQPKCASKCSTYSRQDGICTCAWIWS